MKKKMWKKSLLSLSIALALSGTAWAMPSGGTLVPGGEVAGGLPIGDIADGTTINVTKPSVIEWNSFNIESSETLNFAGQALLNRVTGGDPSAILGHLNITNNAWALVNPNGIVVGPGAVIDASHLLLSTLHVSNEDFMDYYKDYCTSHEPRSRHIAFTTPTGREIPAEVKLQGANITVGKGGIQVYGGTVQLLDGVRITRPYSLYPIWSDQNWDFCAVNHWEKTIKYAGREQKGTDALGNPIWDYHWKESQIEEATNDNLLRLKNANLNHRSYAHSETSFTGGRVEMEDSQIVHDFRDPLGEPIHDGSDIHITALRSLKWDEETMKGQGRYDTAAIHLNRVAIDSVDDIEFTGGTTHLQDVDLHAGRGIYASSGAGYEVENDVGRSVVTKDNVFRMEGGKMYADGHIQMMGGKVEMSGGASLSRGKTLEIVAAKSGVLHDPDSSAAEESQRNQWSSMAMDRENTVQLGDTKIMRYDPAIMGPDPDSTATTFIGGGHVDLGSSHVYGKGAATVAVGAKIHKKAEMDGTHAYTTDPVREKLYTIDKGTSQFPDHTVYLEPELQVTPPIVGPTDVTPPNSSSAAINVGWAAMNEVLKDDAAPEKAAELVKTLNEATKGARTDESVATVIGYAKAIEGSGLSTAEKITMFRTVLDTYQPTVEESTAADAATQAEIDKKDPSPALIFTAQEAFLSGTGEAIDLREPVTGL